MIVNGGYPASLLCRCAAMAWNAGRKQKPAVFNFHNLATPVKWYNAGIESWIDRQVLKAAPHFITVSGNCLESLRIRPAFKNLSAHYFIYNGISDLSRGLSSESSQNNRYCLMLASYEERKGHAYLFNAFRMVADREKDVQLLIYGYGLPEEKARVQQLVNECSLQDRVELHDFTNNTAQLIAGASVLVVPSQAYESFGLTIIEAMSLSVPVVTTDVGGMPEILDGSNCGFVCSKDDPRAFSEAILSILADPALGAQLGMNGKHAFQHRFTAQAMARQYWSVMQYGNPAQV
jgi:glycosyltransferase involved in cell wall biosynthesis